MLYSYWLYKVPYAGLIECSLKRPRKTVLIMLRLYSLVSLIRIKETGKVRQ